MARRTKKLHKLKSSKSTRKTMNQIRKNNELLKQIKFSIIR